MASARGHGLRAPGRWQLSKHSAQTRRWDEACSAEDATWHACMHSHGRKAAVVACCAKSVAPLVAPCRMPACTRQRPAAGVMAAAPLLGCIPMGACRVQALPHACACACAAAISKVMTEGEGLPDVRACMRVHDAVIHATATASARLCVGVGCCAKCSLLGSEAEGKVLMRSARSVSI